MERKGVCMGKKHWIRKLILLIIAVCAITGTIISLNIEPADYRESLNSEIAAAQKLLDEADVGNDSGQYALQAVKIFQKAVDKAKADVQDDSLEYDQLKPIYQEFKEKIDWFKKNANTDVIGKDEVQKALEEKKNIQKTVQIDGGHSANWKLSGSSIQTPAALNLKIGFVSAYEEEITKFLDRSDEIDRSDIVLVTLFHEGKFPGNVELTLDGFSKGSDNLQIYHYNEKTNELGRLIRVEQSDGKLSFPVSEGGTYVLYRKSPDQVLLSDLIKKAPEAGDPSVSKPDGSSSSNPEATEPNDGSNSSDTTTVRPSVDPSSPGQSQEQTTSEKKRYCTIEIRCDTLSNDLSKLTNPALKPYVPSNGVILAKQRVELYDGETVFDLLKRVTRNKKIQLEFRSDSAYTGGAYIEGINHLYEFDGGELSGWMYSVNGWFPNYGCAAYKIEDGDEILWCYTCDLGRDVGDQYFE